MVYRIRYSDDRRQSAGEILVDANSPSEAMIKFHCTNGQQFSSPSVTPKITSVCADNAPRDRDW